MQAIGNGKNKLVFLKRNGKSRLWLIIRGKDMIRGSVAAVESCDKLLNLEKDYCVDEIMLAVRIW